MRSAVIGAYFAHEPEKRKEFVQASSRLTHRGWQAELAALAVAEIVALVAMNQQRALNESEILGMLRGLSTEPEWQRQLSHIEPSLAAGEPVSRFAQRLGLDGGISGYSLHVVPVAIYAWLLHRDNFRLAMTEALRCGGDTDTLGAILGALCGASAGPQNIPKEWLENICEWPRSIGFMRRVANKLAEQKQADQALGAVRYCWAGAVPRNVLFLFAVLLHGLRRLLPPY